MEQNRHLARMASLEAGRTLPWMRWKVEQNRHLARMRQARQARQASRLWKLSLMLWKVEQNRHLARMAGLEAMEIGIERKCKTDTWLGGGKPQGAGLEAWKLQQMRDLARMSQASRLWKASRQAFEAGLEAMEIAAKERLG